MPIWLPPYASSQARISSAFAINSSQLPRSYSTHRLRLNPARLEADPPPRPKGHTVAVKLHPRCGALDSPGVLREVAVRIDGVVSEPKLEAELQRTPQIFEAAEVARVDASSSSELQSARDVVLQAEARSETERAL